MSDGAPKPWPTELRLHKDRRTLTIAFDTGESFDLERRISARAAARAPRCRAIRRTSARPSPASRTSRSSRCNPIGNYAVRLVFDDMHSTGIYSWDYLHELGRNRDANWQDYLDELAGKGLSR